MIRVSGREKPDTGNPLRAIRYKCLDCSGSQWSEVRDCPADDCPLWRFRFGIRPAEAARRGWNVGQSDRDGV